MSLSSRWQKIAGDGFCSSTAILTLSRGGRYRYEFSALIASGTYAGEYGGVHEGTYTVTGDEVSLSGDAKWKSSVHSLRDYQLLGTTEDVCEEGDDHELYKRI
jgi:hypothetical protein